MPQQKPASTTKHAAKLNRAKNRRERDFNDLNREEIIALVKKVAEELGHRPNQFEFWQAAKAKKEHVRRLFGSYRELVQEAGFEALGPGFHITPEQLFEDWVQVVRKTGRVPSVMQYNKLGRYSHRAFRTRWNSWQDVPAAMMEFAKEKWPDRQWDDVLAIAQKYVEERKRKDPRKKKYQRLTSGGEALTTTDKALTSTGKKKGELGFGVCGRPVELRAMLTHPVNEAGVLALFASMAVKLGFGILKVQTAFPDVIALRLCKDGQWRLVRIELEFESRSFISHKHLPEGCDLIVCWKHNWPSCPVEVIELSKLFEE
ncbi:MAG TPA: hypothetical protein VE783_12205 [Candidatus Limnocylindrales bacterium]|jgi:hypothetical protein|nr:hypothetical protein [Candidatus Limnocylindrales bacterium]